MDDKHIVGQARRGELSAFEELVTRYEKRVYAIEPEIPISIGQTFAQ